MVGSGSTATAVVVASEGGEDSVDGMIGVEETLEISGESASDGGVANAENSAAKGDSGGGVGIVGDFDAGSTGSLVEVLATLVAPTPIALSPEDQLIPLRPPVHPFPLPSTRLRETMFPLLSTVSPEASSFIAFINESASSALELRDIVDPRSATVASGELKRMSGSDIVVGIGGTR